MKKIAHYILIAAFPFFLGQCVKDEMPEIEKPNTNDIGLRINEILSTGTPDWIELYNTTSEEIDMSGFKISDGPTPKVTFAAGTKIAAKGYYVFPCNEFGLSSNGEAVYIWDAEGNELDKTSFPALETGLSYGRTTDGGSEWAIMGPTQGKANSTVNDPPMLTVTAIENVSDNKQYEFKVTATDASGMRDVKFFLQAGDDVYFVEMVPLGGGLYSYKLPILNSGVVCKYYVVATDETGKKTFYPEAAPTTKAEFTVANGLVDFTSVALSNENPADGEAVNFTVKVFDKGGVTEVKLYWVLNNADASTKVNITLTTTDNITWTSTIPGQADGTVVGYYLRATDNLGLKSYFPLEEYDASGAVVSEFNHDVASTWPTFTVAPLTYVNALVINEIQTDGAPDYIELYNGTNAAIDISGYRVYDKGIFDTKDETNLFTVPANTIIPAGGFYVIEPAFGISKTSDDIYVEDSNKNKVLEVLGANWPVLPAGSTDYIIARKKDGAEKWERRSVETKGTSNNL